MTDHVKISKADYLNLLEVLQSADKLATGLRFIPSNPSQLDIHLVKEGCSTISTVLERVTTTLNKAALE